MANIENAQIKVTAVPSYQGKGVTINDAFSVWSYNIFIENQGQYPIMILRRYWKVIDEMGLVKEITGDGVVGKKPVINPGESFEYTSFTNMNTSSGVMLGKYYVLNIDSGEEIEIEIPAFSLDTPAEKVTIN